eukprot:03959.XXX_110716_108951_1 [CDS] Oithona nana genome sequencing.
MFRQFVRRFATLQKTGKPESTVLKDPVRQVFISQSNDVFTNLALEDWLYRHHDFAHKHLLLLWRNDPCVVIGRHQNPWTESNVPFLRENKINLARRNSGGGTVYHDLGNLNCTFFTRRSKYDRRRNLDIICNAIGNVTNLDFSVNDREDIVLGHLGRDLKISGTAAKLGKDSAYHHCTVLVDVNECVLHDALHSKADGVESRATQSVRVPVKNLAAVSPNLSVGLLQEAVGWQFLRTNVQGEDDGYENSRGFQMVRPDNDWFPGLDQLRADFISHQWVFGKTPKFKVSKKFQVPQNIFDDILNDEKMMIEIEVNKGVIVDVRLQMPPGLLDPELMDLSEVLLKMDFDGKLVQNFAARLEAYVELSAEKKNFFIQSVDEMIRNFV